MAEQASKNNGGCRVSGCGSPAHLRQMCTMHYQKWLKYGIPDAGARKYKTPQDAFECRTQWEPNSGCLIWTGSITTKGYGQLRVDGILTQTHRFAWEAEYEPILNGLHVLHHCDTPSCCNVDHLFLGTNADNVADMVAKARQFSKLTSCDVRKIRNDTRFQRIIAAQYGVTQATVSLVKSRNLWGYVS